MKQFISNILTAIAALINPYRPDPRYEECHFWFRLCCEEFELGQQAYAMGDIEQWRVHVNNQKLLSRRFRMAREGHFTKP